ncbi:MAG: GNAT family N-acetyltransferase [Actinomycetota bacterium]|nr:GNAT family N-acetyltransferase [Actinomycetota bacterium]
MKDPVALCADAMAGWHAGWLTALGLRSAADADAWRALDQAPHIYLSAITLRPDTPAGAVADAAGAVCDSWQTIDLEPFGFRDWRHEPWFLCPTPPSSADTTPPELEIVRAATAQEVEEVEAVSVRGFGNEDDTIEPGTIHPPAILDEPRMVMWLGRVEGKPVGAAMSYRTDEAVGIFGVTTIASMRQRGYGTALTRAAMLGDSGLPSILAPSPEGEGVYRRLGFEQVGELRIWSRQT